ncbi:gamma-glutamyl-gamma-aminobutyrate hydrolase family protein [Alkalilimnicola sp. S0819]|uniref:gamma-glutamyl-gamma-aminobutyrate hydrolase family protein n=1 Tax=Alkalilimnicola sp. S0819 TaxID=2613922 RepID=UPI001262000C|nr:gamma-glutamyl-gamma-aminobutyrate hydrolase family protein [Alkalilimnicola sp. S0819]KAB7622779.1 gamma-glutamyl-gamma-aminobutyrate hydrolase family protein [Alkalilimnicola sp. S0819]MPQ17275.1 gamma-glutamyl-gamma-aminobutyrate hydrolase family protein [Alkalilimnicola sp. S0819]
MAGKARPLIGVTGPDRGGAVAWWFTRRALRRAGARACRITPSRPPRDLARLDGLIVGGGADVAPELYGAEAAELGEFRRREPSRWRYLLGLLLFPLIFLLRKLFSLPRHQGRDAARDELESSLIDQALHRGLPILGICRGLQLLNVRSGGTLHQDLSDFYEEIPQAHTVWPAKPIVVEPGSHLAAILGTSDCLVNSLHRQGIDRLGKDMRVVAWEHSGVIQAIEHSHHPFVLGVQWHPEYLPQQESQQRLFAALVRAANT